jgi:hypothetical protein
MKDINSKNKRHLDPYLGKFLDCIDTLSMHATDMNDSLVSELSKEFNLGRASASKL